LVGPYALHDFFIYNFLRNGFSPAKIEYLAEKAFEGEFSAEEIKHWSQVFLRRFFSQQFKRSAMPDGPKVVSVSLSPRGDLRMSSDASVAEWLK
jgi:NAD+ synthase (glutamine-hydrolysing)